MDMHSRNEYVKELQQRYFQTRSKKEKSSILDEYCRNTRQNRKYVIRKIRSFSNGSFSGRGMTFLFCRKYDIFTLH